MVLEQAKVLIAGVIGSNVPWLDYPGLQCYNMDHNSHGLNLYGVLMVPVG